MGVMMGKYLLPEKVMFATELIQKLETLET